jgi:dsDNA-specific endonuclease/ATPase MutS2
MEEIHEIQEKLKELFPNEKEKVELIVKQLTHNASENSESIFELTTDARRVDLVPSSVREKSTGIFELLYLTSKKILRFFI